MKNFVNKLTSSDRYIVVLLAILSSFFFIGLGHLHLFDWDEINFAESAREMIESGDYLHVQVNFIPFWEKPPFFFWLQAASMQLFGIGEYAARFPNALFGFITLISIYFIGKKHFNAKFGLIWALLFFGTLLPHIYFKSGIIDPVFNYFIFMSIYFMLRVIGKDNNAGKLALFSGIFSGLSVLTKGPVGFLLLGLTLFVYLIIKKFKPFPKVKYIVLFLLGLTAMITAWLMAELSQNGWDNMLKFIQYQVELFNQDVAGHAQPFYYHFVVILLGCFPISLLAIPGFRSKEDTSLDLHTWMIILFWVVLITFSITTTKIIHYSSMTYLPLAFLAAIVLTRKEVIRTWLKSAYVVHGLLIGIGLIILPYLLMDTEWLISVSTDQFTIDCLSADNHWTFWSYMGGGLVVVGTILTATLIKRDRIMALLIHGICLGAALLFTLYTILPNVENITQNPAIDFYESRADEDCYIETVSFHSYAQYFYGRTKQNRNAQSDDLVWLMTGEIDKPVYFVTKSNNLYLDERFPEYHFLYAKGGYRFYKREP